MSFKDQVLHSRIEEEEEEQEDEKKEEEEGEEEGEGEDEEEDEEEENEGNQPVMTSFLPKQSLRRKSVRAW